MNVAEKKNQFEMEAKTFNHKEKRNIIYSFVDSYHSLCLERNNTSTNTGMRETAKICHG